MNAVRIRLMAFAAAAIFVVSVRSQEVIGVEHAVEECFVAVIIATVITAVVSFW